MTDPTSPLKRRDFLLAAGGVALAAATAVPAFAAPAATSPAAGGPKFRLGLVTYNLAANWDLATLLKVCKATGVSPVEFRTTHKHGVEPSLSKEERQDVRKKCQDSGVEIWGAGTVCEFQSADPDVVAKNIERCKEFVGLVADLGGKGVKVRPNGLPKDVPVEKTLDQIGKSLIPCGKAAADAGLEIFVEVHGPGTADPPKMKTIMEACGHPAVGVCWNSNNGEVVNGSIADNFRMLRPWLKSCHINELYKDAAGVYPYRELFRLMRETDYDRVTLCEASKTPPDAASGEEMLRYYKALWTELNR